MKLVQTILGGGGGSARLLALAALLGLLAAAALSLAPAAAEGELDQFELVLSLEEDSDNVVPAGSELTVNAALRFPWQLPITPPADQPSYVPYKLDVPGAGSALSRLRISGNLEWDSAGRQRLAIAAQTPIEAAYTGPGSGWSIRAFDGRTIVARPHNDRILRIHDSYTLAHAATISTPAGAGGNHNSGFGASDARQTGRRGAWIGKAIDVWHETADRAWLFVGSWPDNVDSQPEAGRLYRYRLDWDDEGVTVTPMGALGPPATESRNRHGQTWAWYGAAVAFSRDGSTLAVTAPRMNMMGAVYVYSRPDGPGEDWGDVEYADGVKVSVGEVPSWGVTFGEMPFNPNSASGCDAWCSMVWSSAAREGNHIAGLGSQRVSLSADGRVLVVGNGTKPYSLTTPGGSFNNANRRDNAGEAYVWIAPEGGWQSAPLANRDAEGNRRTVFAAKTNATSFRRATHYSPGPLRRWTEPAAVLTRAAWPNPGNSQFGREAVVSADGSTVAVGDSSNAVYIFQRDSAGDWASAAGGYLTPDATLSGLWAPDEGPMHFSPDGRELAVGQIPGNAVRVFSRPANGTWVSATGSTARLVRVPAGANSSRFGSVIPELSGQRVALANQSSSTDFVAYPTIRGRCTTSTVDGETTASCPLTLPGSTITIPEGTPDGPFVISGSVALQPNGGDPVTVRGSLEVTVGDVDELAKVEFDFATDASTGQPYPSVVAPGGSTTLLLKLLNENGKASAKGAAASVLFTASRGALSATLGAAAGEACSASGGASCRLPNPATELTADNSDQIRLTVTHPGANKAGAARIRAVVVNSAGRNFAIEPIVVTFSGTPTALAIAQPPTALLGYAPAGSVDQRNRATLVVSASDARGNKAAAPTSRYSAKLTDSDGKEVTSQQVELTWPLREGGAADGALVLRDGSPQARVTILASAAAPLAVGEYTLELSAGSGGGKLTAEQTIVVAGGAAEVTLSADPAGEIEPGASVTVTAVVTDASGALVPDGTPVRFTELSTSENVVLVLRSSAGQLTRNGEASVTLRAINSGGAYVTADADDVSGAQVINVAAPPPTPLSEYVTSTAANAFSIWTGPQLITAAQLLASLEGVSRIRKQIDSVWVSYGETNGRLNPGSVNFAIGPGDILWLGG